MGNMVKTATRIALETVSTMKYVTARMDHAVTVPLDIKERFATHVSDCCKTAINT